MRRLLKHQLRFTQLLDASKDLCKITYFTQVSVSYRIFRNWRMKMEHHRGTKAGISAQADRLGALDLFEWAKCAFFGFCGGIGGFYEENRYRHGQ